VQMLDAAHGAAGGSIPVIQRVDQSGVEPQERTIVIARSIGR